MLVASALDLGELAAYGVFLATIVVVALIAVPLTAGIGPRGGSNPDASPREASG